MPRLVKRLYIFSSFLWLLTRTFAQLLYGVWRISALSDPVISIFGGGRLKKSDEYVKKAHDLAARLVRHNISVATGAGPGIMEAASCGAFNPNNKLVRSIGIGVRDLDERKNPCVQEYFELDQFFARKWLLTRYSMAFIVFPGGFGTLDELAEVLTLIQTKHLGKVPIILYGVEYWKQFIDWIKQEVIKHTAICQEDLELFYVTDDFDEIFRHICAHCAKKYPSVIPHKH